jgi:hypothetical protein
VTAPDRRARLELLLGALPDYGPAPETSTGRLQRRATLPGPAPHHRGPCPACERLGRVESTGMGLRPCPRCRVERAALVPARAHESCLPCPACGARGTVAYDGYTNRPVVTADGSPAPTTDADRRDKARRDAARVSAILDGDRDQGGGDALDAQLARSERLERWSFRPLIAALDELRSDHNLAYRLIVDVHVTANREPASVAAPLLRRLEFGMRYLDRRMPDRIRVPREVLEQAAAREQWLRAARGRRGPALAARDRELRRQRQADVPVPELMARFGLSRASVYAVLAADPSRP